MKQVTDRLPHPLQPGDLLRVIAPSGALSDMTALKQGIEIWRKRGYRVEMPEQIDQQWGYLAGQDHHRVQQLLTALADPECRGILCARGGYGGARLLEMWGRPDTWHLAPDTWDKWLLGFSDITALLWGLYAQGFMGGVHSAVLTTLAAEPEWTIDRLFHWLEGQGTLPTLQGVGWGGGGVTGVLLPANLTVATHMLHTPWQPDLRGIILALEDVSEAPYRLDRMLTHWRMTGMLQQVGGIALGRFSQCDSKSSNPSFTVEEVLRDRLGDLGIPIVAGLPFGHDGENAALPVGTIAHLDGNAGLLSFQ
jgi:muramoyltetrapeptide carboxypeptidase